MADEEEITNEQMSEEDLPNKVNNLVGAYNLLLEAYDMWDKWKLDKIRERRFMKMIEKLENKMFEAIEKL